MHIFHRRSKKQKGGHSENRKERAAPDELTIDGLDDK